MFGESYQGRTLAEHHYVSTLAGRMCVARIRRSNCREQACKAQATEGTNRLVQRPKHLKVQRGEPVQIPWRAIGHDRVIAPVIIRVTQAQGMPQLMHDR